MATNYVQEGKVITFTAGAAYSSGDVVVLGQQIGIAVSDVASGAVGELAIEGVYTLAKVSAAVIAAGEEVVYDITAEAFDDNAITAAAGDISGCCVAVEAGAATTTTIDVKINVGVGTVETG